MHLVRVAQSLLRWDASFEQRYRFLSAYEHASPSTSSAAKGRAQVSLEEQQIEKAKGSDEAQGQGLPQGNNLRWSMQIRLELDEGSTFDDFTKVFPDRS